MSAVTKITTKIAVMLWAGCVFAAAPAETCDPCISSLLRTTPSQTECESHSKRLISIHDALKGLTEFLDHSALSEPHALLILYIVNHWFDGDRYSDAKTRYDHAITARPEEAHVLRLFGRVMDHSSPLNPPDLERVSTDFDPVTARALHCDRLELGTDYVSLLINAVSQGGYALTHAALAWAWLQENRCTLAIPPNFEMRLVTGMAAMIDLDDPVTDREIEAAAILHALGYGNYISEAFVDQVLAAQQPGGGFRMSSTSEGKPNWHTSVLAFWLLLQHACPVDGRRPMLARPMVR